MQLKKQITPLGLRHLNLEENRLVSQQYAGFLQNIVGAQLT